MPWTHILSKRGCCPPSSPSSLKHRNGCGSNDFPAIVSPRSSSKQNSLKASEVIGPDNAHNIEIVSNE